MESNNWFSTWMSYPLLVMEGTGAPWIKAFSWVCWPAWPLLEASTFHLSPQDRWPLQSWLPLPEVSQPKTRKDLRSKGFCDTPGIRLGEMGVKNRNRTLSLGLNWLLIDFSVQTGQFSEVNSQQTISFTNIFPEMTSNLTQSKLLPLLK